MNGQSSAQGEGRAAPGDVGPDSRSPAHPAEQDPRRRNETANNGDGGDGGAFRRRPKRPPPRFTDDDGPGDDSGDELEGVRIRGRPAPKSAAFSRPSGRSNSNSSSKEASFDEAAPLPQPSRPSAAGASSQRRKIAFAAADGTPVSIASSTAGSTPSNASTSTPAFRVSAGGATPSSSVSKSVHWKKQDERAAKRENRSPSPDAVTIAARNASEAEASAFEDKFKAEVAADGLDIDRDWYLREEDGGVDESGGMYQVEDSYKRGGQQTQEVERLRDRTGRLMNKRDSQKVAAIERDMSRWDEIQLLRSGVAVKVGEDDEEEDKERVMLVVSDAKPPFLDGRQIFTKQMDPVLPLKDPTSDMAVVARRGSKLVMQLREKKDEAATRERFWDVTQSKIGQLTGTTAQEQADAAAATDEANKLSVKFGGTVVNEEDTAADADGDTHMGTHMKKGEGISEFAKTRTLSQQRRALPVYSVRQAFLDLVREHQVVIVVGETGSGKTTQLTQYLREDGYAGMGMIGCTQPRRVAAMSVAHRVADEVGCEVGQEVGYAIRFEDCTSEQTKVKYMTDGVLLRETLRSGELDGYRVVIMDEAHERSLNTDVLFGILKEKVLSMRRDFRLIVTSATLDSDKFSRFFGGAPVFEIPGRTFPVDVDYARTPQEDYVSAAVERALKIHVSEPVDGDILVFMTGREEIEATAFQLQDRLEQMETSNKDLDPLLVLPLYSELPGERQALIFDAAPPGARKCVIATNIAETSLTIDGIKYVIDCGYCKFKVFSPKMGMDSLQVFPVSQAGARQRQGRAGRTGPGKSYPMYTKSQYDHEMLVANVPEIQRTNLSNVVLLLKSLNVDNLLHFPFMDPPPQENIVASMFQLWTLGAFSNLGALTPLGKKMVEFPLDPPLAKMLITGAKLGCGDEVLTIVSMLSAPSIFYRPSARQEAADAAHEKFFCPESDHLTLLNVYQQWKSHGYRDMWAKQGYLQPKALRKAKEVREQLKEIMEQQKLKVESIGPDTDIVRKAICSAYFHNAARMKGIGEYQNCRSGMPCHLHPSSALFGMGLSPDYIVYHELVYTHKEYMNQVTAVDPQWLAELGPVFFKIKERNQPGVSKRTMERNAAIEMEAQRLAQAARETKLKVQADYDRDGDRPADTIVGVLSARDKRQREQGVAGITPFRARKRFGN